MPKKRVDRPHDHYCKICGEYKAHEKFSGKGHATHICKVCSRLSASEKAEAMTINRIMDMPMGRLSESDKKWLQNRTHDHRPEVASLAREVYGLYFPYAERNARKKQLLINTLVFELHNVTVYDEFGDEYPVSRRFSANRLTNVLTITDFDAGGTEQSVVLEKKQMAKLLRWVIHTLEIFMWEEDYALSPDDPYPDVPYPSGPYLDLLPEYWLENWSESEKDSDDSSEDTPPEQEAKVYWQAHIEYADETTQEIASYQNHLFDKPDELFFALSEYFQTDDAEFDEGMEE